MEKVPSPNLRPRSSSAALSEEASRAAAQLEELGDFLAGEAFDTLDISSQTTHTPSSASSRGGAQNHHTGHKKGAHHVVDVSLLPTPTKPATAPMSIKQSSDFAQAPSRSPSAVSAVLSKSPTFSKSPSFGSRLDSDAALLAVSPNAKGTRMAFMEGNVDTGSTEDAQNWILMKSAARGEADKVEQLLADKDSRGVRINSVDSFGWTSLIQAAHVGALQVCKVLLRYGADVRCITKEGDTVLHHLYRAPNDNLDDYFEVLVAILKQNQQLVHYQNAAGETALHKLCLRCDVETVSSFIKFSPAHINALNARGETPLFYAVRANNRELVALLLQLGADPGVVSKDGTALTVAIQLGFTAVHDVLKGYTHKIRKQYPNLSKEKMFVLEKFGISPNEHLLLNVPCEERQNLLTVPGRLFLSSNYVFFYSFNPETNQEVKHVIPLTEVSALEKRSSLFISAIELFTRSQKYYFSGFPNRSEIFATLEEATAKKQQDGVMGTQQRAEPHWELITPARRMKSVPGFHYLAAALRDDSGFLIDKEAAEEFVEYRLPASRLQIQTEGDWKKFLRELSPPSPPHPSAAGSSSTVAVPNANDLDSHVRKRSDKLRQLVRRGIPADLRGELWWKLSGAVQKMKLAQMSYANYVALSEASSAAKDIEKDVCRTFPEHPYFQSESGIDMLRRILLAYSVRNSSLGYCQGMNFLAGYLILWMQEEQAFWTLCFLVEDILLDYFGRNMIGSLVDQKLFESLLQRALPRVWNHLLAIGFPSSAVTTSWLCCLFVNSIPKATALRVWDFLMFEGAHVIFLVAVSLFRLAEEAVLAEHESFKLIELLRERGIRLFDADELIRVALEDIAPRLPPLDKQLHNLRFAHWISSENELCSQAAKTAKMTASPNGSASTLLLTTTSGSPTASVTGVTSASPPVPIRSFVTGVSTPATTRPISPSPVVSVERNGERPFHAQYKADLEHLVSDPTKITFEEFKMILLRLAPKWPTAFAPLELLFAGFATIAPSASSSAPLLSGSSLRRLATIDFDQLVAGLHVLQRGTGEDKLKLFFRCFDENRKGLITKNAFHNMAQLLHTYHKHVQQQTSSSSAKKSVGSRVIVGDLVTPVPAADAVDFEEWKELTRQHHSTIVQCFTVPLGDQLLSTTP